ncbi:MAG TPA: alcohol dehydrogenase catalytic domain-containing protein [Actinomycetota bacterium]|nr:alcohol dehydrogenase catalytic domain-containing protein [Actinomycetota bacterium]
MRAVVYRGVGKVEVEDLPDPELLEPTDAIVRVTTTSICGSDLHLYHGKAPLDPGDGIGHEAVGVVEAVGSAVERFSPGERVVVSFTIACGVCWFCRAGQTQLCEDFAYFGYGIFGGSLGGAQAELLRVPLADNNLLHVPDDVDDERALFVGDTLTTGVYAAGLAGVGEGQTVAVVGAGPVGLFSAQAALAAGADQVLAIELDPARLDLAERAGAVPIDPRTRNAQTAVAERTDGRGADVVVEAVGTVPAFERALDLARRGGVVVVMGVFTSETVSAQFGVWWIRALQIRLAGTTPIHTYWERAMRETRARRLDPLPIVSHRMTLEDAAKAYELFDSKQATKILLSP